MQLVANLRMFRASVKEEDLAPLRLAKVTYSRRNGVYEGQTWNQDFERSLEAILNPAATLHCCNEADMVVQTPTFTYVT